MRLFLTIPSEMCHISDLIPEKALTLNTFSDPIGEIVKAGYACDGSEQIDLEIEINEKGAAEAFNLLISTIGVKV